MNCKGISNLFRLLKKANRAKNEKLVLKILPFFEAKTLQVALLKVENNLPSITRISPKQMLLNTLSDVYEDVGNFKKATFFKKEWSNLSVKRAYDEQLNISNFMDLELAISNLNKEKIALEVKEKLSYTHKIILGLSIIIVFFLGLFFSYRQKLRTKAERLSKITVEKNLLESFKEKTTLKNELEAREKELNRSIIVMIEKNNQIEVLNKQLEDSKSKNRTQITQKLAEQKSLVTNDWHQFMFNFKQLYPNFLAKIKKENPTISPTETKLSILIFLNLSSKEIASLLNISPTSVNQGKYRLKKKMNLEKEKNLTHFLQEL